MLASASITAEEALKTNVIDFIAADLPDLLKQLDGRVINGIKMHTANATLVEIPMTRGNIFRNCSCGRKSCSF